MLAVAALAAVLLLARDGDDERDERRAAVSAYIVQVNTTQQALIVELERVSTTYRQLQLKPDEDPRQLQRVEGAARTLRRLRSRLAELVAPTEVRALRSRLLNLVDLQIALADEVAGMVRYLPVQAREARAVSSATKRLRDELGDAKTVEAQRRVFTAYEDALRLSVARLRSGTSPAIFEPSRKGEVTRLTRLLSLSRQVRAALEKQDATEIDRLFARFVQTSASVGTTKAERDAVIAFNKRLSAISEARSAVAAERAQLDLELR